MVNPELDQDRAFDLYDTYRKYGYVMFPQQRRIYEQLAKKCAHKRILEAGCGNGIGSALLERTAGYILATDKLPSNIGIARELYPWMFGSFVPWDVNKPCPYPHDFDTAVAVEVIEHVADPVTALRNMIAAATETLWISTPNGKHAKQPPENPYHVAEYTTSEMLGMIGKVRNVSILAWDNFNNLLPLDTDITPLVYRIDL